MSYTAKCYQRILAVPERKKIISSLDAGFYFSGETLRCERHEVGKRIDRLLWDCQGRVPEEFLGRNADGSALNYLQNYLTPNGFFSGLSLCFRLGLSLEGEFLASDMADLDAINDRILAGTGFFLPEAPNP